MSFYIREENRFALGVLKNYLYEYKVELQTHQSPHKFTQNLAYFTSHEANNFAWQSYLARKSFHSNNFKDTQRVEKKKYPIKITWLNSHKLISSFCYSSKGQECVWLKAVSHEVMSFQSVSKSPHSHSSSPDSHHDAVKTGTQPAAIHLETQGS